MAARSLVVMGADSDPFPTLGFIPPLGKIASRWGESRSFSLCLHFYISALGFVGSVKLLRHGSLLPVCSSSRAANRKWLLLPKQEDGGHSGAHAPSYGVSEEALSHYRLLTTMESLEALRVEHLCASVI